MTDPKNQTSANATGALRAKLTGPATPGYQAEFDLEEAERAGAFVADALSEEDAADSNAGLVDVLGEEQPGFLDAAAPSAEIPAFIRRANARERFGMAPGETAPEAIARHNARDIERTPPRGHEEADHDCIPVATRRIFSV